MLKNHKLLAVSTVTITSAVLCVLGFWLYNTYEDHQELTFAKADQALLSTLNDYYIRHEITASNSRNSYQKNLVADISRAYPEVVPDSIYAWMDRNATRRQDSIRQKFRDIRRNSVSRERNDRRKPREINHWMLQSRDANLSPAAIDTLLEEYKEELAANGIHLAQAKVYLRKIDRRQRHEHRHAGYSSTHTTRPILINAENDLYLYAELEQTWRHIASTMAGQFVFSFLLLLALSGTFFTLFKTISKQDKLAKLQRTFVTNMTHELKTPLSIVSAAIESLQRTGISGNPERREKYLQISKRELEHLNDMVEGVLQFDSYDRSGIRLAKTTFDLVELLSEMKDSFQLANEHQIDLQLITEQRELPFFGDVSHLRNMFSNLIDNGIKYNQAKVPQIRITLLDHPDTIVISIRDNGIGIPAEYQRDIYTLFFRVPTGDLYSVKGFGLGLAYVRQVVEEHAGKINLHSTTGKGTQFTITLPKLEQVN